MTTIPRRLYPVTYACGHTSQRALPYESIYEYNRMRYEAETRWCPSCSAWKKHRILSDRIQNERS